MVIHRHTTGYIGPYQSDESVNDSVRTRFGRDHSIGTTSSPTPLFNDSNGAVDWSDTGKVSKKLRILYLSTGKGAKIVR